MKRANVAIKGQRCSSPAAKSQFCDQNCSDCVFRLSQSVAEGPTSRSVRCTTTTSLSKTKVVHLNRGDGKVTRLGRANRCGNLNFSKPCPKLPERARRHWRNSAPSERLDCYYWAASLMPIIRIRVCFQVCFSRASCVVARLSLSGFDVRCYAAVW